MTWKGKPPANPPGRGGESFEIVELGEPVYRMAMPEGTRVVKAVPRPEPIEIVETPFNSRPVLALRLVDSAETPADGLPDDVVNLVLSVSRKEQSLGGQGLALMSRKIDAGVLTVTLNPVAIGTGTEARLRALADELNLSGGLTAEVRSAA